jgi:hypothetical protein
VFIKNYLNKKYMAEKSKEKKGEKKKSHHHGGEIPFGLEVVLFVLAIFVIWVLMGGAKKGKVEDPFIKQTTNKIQTSTGYGAN